MTINRRWNKARKVYRCDVCAGRIHIGEEYCRVFGMAERGDPPFAIRLCRICVDHEDLGKVRRAGSAAFQDGRATGQGPGAH